MRLMIMEVGKNYERERERERERGDVHKDDD